MYTSPSTNPLQQEHVPEHVIEVGMYTAEVRKKWDYPLWNVMNIVIYLDVLSLKNYFHINYPVMCSMLLLSGLDD